MEDDDKTLEDLQSDVEMLRKRIAALQKATPPLPSNDPPSLLAHEGQRQEQEHIAPAGGQAGEVPSVQGRMQEYWRKNITLIAVLLVVWALVSLGFGIILVKPMNSIMNIGGLPLGFWFAQQGSVYIFIIEIFVYSIVMDRLDKAYDVHE